MSIWVYGCIGVWVRGCIGVCVCGCMGVRVYVCARESDKPNTSLSPVLLANSIISSHRRGHKHTFSCRASGVHGDPPGNWSLYIATSALEPPMRRLAGAKALARAMSLGLCRSSVKPMEAFVPATNNRCACDARTHAHTRTHTHAHTHAHTHTHTHTRNRSPLTCVHGRPVQVPGTVGSRGSSRVCVSYPIHQPPP